MSNVPDKFYQVCRLCMAVVCDSDIPELSIHGVNKQRSLQSAQSLANPQNNSTVIISTTLKSDETNVLNHTNDSSLKLASDSNTTIDCNAAGLLNDGNVDGVEDDDDDSRIDIHERIYTFLAITVSQLNFFYYLSDYMMMFFLLSVSKHFQNFPMIFF